MSLPEWFRQRVVFSPDSEEVISVLGELKLNTVCESACCPNRWGCYSNRTATFMILGAKCSRNCGFCAVLKGNPQTVDEDEPERIREGVRRLGLRYVVITSVCRDDLPYGGAKQFYNVTLKLKELNPQIKIELLIPDFNGDKKAFETVMDAEPDVVGHNIETVARLYKEVRPEASYERSLRVLRSIKSMDGKTLIKSGLMLGFGEKPREVKEAMKDLRDSGCDMLTIGQYLSPSGSHLPVREYIKPHVFESYREEALLIGFKAVASGPLVRSSYKSHELFKRCSD